jgi:hypothetical protein
VHARTLDGGVFGWRFQDLPLAQAGEQQHFAGVLQLYLGGLQLRLGLYQQPLGNGVLLEQPLLPLELDLRQIQLSLGLAEVGAPLADLLAFQTDERLAFPDSVSPFGRQHVDATGDERADVASLFSLLMMLPVALITSSNIEKEATAVLMPSTFFARSSSATVSASVRS